MNQASVGPAYSRDLPRGIALIHDPRYNKGTAFTAAERDALGLHGLLPTRVSSMDEQLLRVRDSLERKPSAIEKYIFLVGLQDRNETLFYRFTVDHLKEVMPILYTPTVGEACRTFGHIFRRPRGLYLSIHDRGRVREILRNWPEPQVDVIVVTDGERILGLGDLGAQGMGIPIGKLSLYTACAGVHPDRCLPITLDVGTDNESLLHDPLYTGLYERRERGPAYDEFVDEFVDAVQDVFPEALLQWEDFATANAIRLLARHRDRVCCFNDDIQGTAAVALAALLSACRTTGKPLAEQRLLFFGAGASATGVANLLTAAMVRQGLSREAALRSTWLVDSKGLVVASRTDLAPHKQRYAHEHAPVADLLAAVRALRPTALIGLSAQAQAFDEPVLRAMAEVNSRPIVFALSNPTSRAECTAEQAYRFTMGRVLFASGSPFEPVELDGRRYVTSQANNSYVFPGLGLGIVLSRARRVPDAMFHAAAAALAEMVPAARRAEGALLPAIDDIRQVSARIAATTARLAASEGLARVPVPDDVERWVAEQAYVPVYPAFA